MMGSTKQIYEELLAVRTALRAENVSANGREPKICTDEALMDMAVRLPAKTNDLLLIRGIGETFAEKYGERFLQITRKYIRDTAKSVPLSGNSASVLKDLEKKLINLSKGNSLLFSPRIVKSRTFDITASASADPLGTIFRPEKEQILCRRGDDCYEAINQISRETLRDWRERGVNELYLAYPFASGRLADGDFPIRAPLALFPVSMTKSQDVISIRYDETRDAVFNNTLLLAFMKFGGIGKKMLPDPSFDPSEEGLIDQILSFYRGCGIRIERGGSELQPFREYRPERFPVFGPNEMHLETSALVGKFPLYSNSIQRDFDGLTVKPEINKILSDLISPWTDAEGTMQSKDVIDRGMSVSEKDITYINEVNSSQEQVMAAMDWMDELVVQGPPGTGKSQVITSLITDAVNKGRTVLMVSEKKTALDVVYSRLGHLSKYVMMIDDATNKDLFYGQLRAMLDIPPAEGPAKDTSEIADEIDGRVNELTRIADGMFSPGEFGVEPYRMYSLVRKVDLNDPEEHRRYELLKENISASLLAVKFPDLYRTYERFMQRETISNMRTYYQCLDTVPWIAMMKKDLTVRDLESLKRELAEIHSSPEEQQSGGFLSRLFGRGQANRRATAILDRYFVNYNAKNIDQLMNRTEETIESLDLYPEYAMKMSAYEELSRLERTYGENLISVNTKIPGTYDMSNDELFAFIMMDHLRRFEEENSGLLQEIDDFEDTRRTVDSLIAEKRSVTKERMENIFRDHLNAVTDSKMSAEIRRVAESRRRWSVNKFLNRFGSDMFRGIKVWLMTPDAVSELLPLEMGLFDMLIFDEASQMYVEKGIPSIYRAKKVVVAGDHMQLRPSSLGSGRMTFDDEEESAALEEDSLLDLARTRYDSVLLNFHYRSKYEELIAFSNYAFYGGRLYVSPNVDVPAVPPIETHLVEDGRWEDKSNRKEAEATVGLLKEILSERKENETVGIITFNVSQRDLIYDLIEDESSKDPEFGRMISEEMGRRENGEDVGLFLKNIESVQGDERDVIIFSVGYAKNETGRIAQRFGWLNNAGGENRLNVAISRARKKVHIITSFLPQELDVSDAKNEGPKYLRKYLEYSFAVSGGDRKKEESILGSFAERRTAVPDRESVFNGQICDALIARGFDAEKNVGIGGYSIDVAVKKGDRYVLGIECDNSLYTGAISTRERDYHRQKYLESRGWKVRRVWSNHWWNDPEKELESIIKEIE